MKKARKSPFRLDKVAIMFIAPAFIFYTLFIIVPTVSNYYSFTSWTVSVLMFVSLGWQTTKRFLQAPDLEMR